MSPAEAEPLQVRSFSILNRFPLSDEFLSAHLPGSPESDRRIEQARVQDLISRRVSLLRFGQEIARSVHVDDISTLSGLDQIRWKAYAAQDGSQRMQSQLDTYILTLDQAFQEKKPIHRHTITLLNTLQEIYDRTHNPSRTNETDLTFADVLQVQRLLSHDIALFGTILSNKVRGAYPWMSETERELLARGRSVFDPDNGPGVKERDETAAIENESYQLTVGSGVRIINYEQQGGGVSLSEIVDMLISLRETALAAIVNFQGDGTSIDEKRARIVAHTVLRYMTSRENLDVRVLNSPFDGVEEFPLEEILEEALQADMRIQTRRKQSGDMAVEQIEPKQFTHKAVLIGSSKPGDDMDNRAVLLETLHKAYGDSVVDTFNPNFDGPNGEFNTRSVEENMHSDLEAMNNAEHIVVYIGRNTLAQFATLKTALWFSLVNGSRVTVCVSDDIEGSYAGQTAQSHLAELTEQIPAIQSRLIRIQTPSELAQVL